ncbi:hypothetical protein H8356DRAFT_1420724 [Neocallimastix lanati (nom. inval.)]|nr:hypothetical protein H8356DRAFT_1420724 [Neocallimastix sp. JGI-2020a]
MHTKYISICNKNIRVCKFTYKIRMPKVLARKFGIKRKFDNCERVLLNKRRKTITALVRKSDVNKEICLYRYYFLFGTEEVINKNFKKYELESRKIKKIINYKIKNRYFVLFGKAVDCEDKKQKKVLNLNAIFEIDLSILQLQILKKFIFNHHSLINIRKFLYLAFVALGSARSFICKNFANSNKLPVLGLNSQINIQLPNGKSMNIRQTAKPLKLKFMDHKETFEFCIANLSLQGINEYRPKTYLGFSFSLFLDKRFVKIRTPFDFTLILTKNVSSIIIRYNKLDN